MTVVSGHGLGVGVQWGEWAEGLTSRPMRSSSRERAALFAAEGASSDASCASICATASFSARAASVSAVLRAYMASSEARSAATCEHSACSNR